MRQAQVEALYRHTPQRMELAEQQAKAQRLPIQLPTRLARRLAKRPLQAIPRHSTRQGHLVAQLRQHTAVLIM